MAGTTCVFHVLAIATSLDSTSSIFFQPEVLNFKSQWHAYILVCILVPGRVRRGSFLLFWREVDRPAHPCNFNFLLAMLAMVSSGMSFSIEWLAWVRTMQFYEGDSSLDTACLGQHHSVWRDGDCCNRNFLSCKFSAAGILTSGVVRPLFHRTIFPIVRWVKKNGVRELQCRAVIQFLECDFSLMFSFALAGCDILWLAATYPLTYIYIYIYVCIYIYIYIYTASALIRI